MCLSNVYEKSPDADNLLLRNIADVRFEGDALVLTDIMGITRRLEAKVKKIDLLENYIIVETEEQPA
ncbi:MAG: CooT family nickel-binding protein [Firmicutes bacterium]|jgi:predicted RNA-binding protein|nr:CooT family nickel-binding protein [Bacillota bacterium]MBQ4411006.1 CooT family nickel-binding protein [Bacillota bacterium]MBQ6294883.1 CooT family nickel-binding protein [Bacillota bacterium]MBR0051764.1 CooT family nickel-binding protein [Bacillota bacterium]MBR3034098.1 CooT family nickel-binding protein [Bacillota bacterium]